MKLDTTMSTGAVKPRCRGRGLGVGWIGKYKPKPCQVSKEDILNLPQSFADASSQPPPLLTQSSVENLSDRIARDILGSQGDEDECPATATTPKSTKTARTVIDLTGSTDDEFDDSADSTRSWIDSIDNDSTLGAPPLDEKRKTTLKKDENLCDSTENVMKAYNDGFCDDFHTPRTSPTPPKIPTSTEKKENSTNNIICGDEKPGTRLLDDSSDSITKEINKLEINTSPVQTKTHTDLFLKAVHAEEFVPSWYSPTENAPTDEKTLPVPAENVDVPSDEKSVGVFTGPQPFEDFEDTVVLYVLDQVIAALMDDPGDFDDAIEQLTDHLVNFVTQEDTLKQVINRIIGKAIAEPNFCFTAAKLAQHFDDCKAVKLENGVTFRKVFFQSCQTTHGDCLAKCKDVESCKANKEIISRTALLFGELLCTMKLKGKVNPIYRMCIEEYINVFLDIGSDETITILATLLKLVGPELDINRPKDVEALFDKVRDFYLGPRSANLSKSVKTNLWNVYKLHSRDWDRATSPLDSPRDGKFFDPQASANPLVRQKSTEARSERSSSRSSPINWDEYYDGGDDLDLYQNYMDRHYPGEFRAEDYSCNDRGEYWFSSHTGRRSVTDEECDAFEEFLKMSGQV